MGRVMTRRVQLSFATHFEAGFVGAFDEFVPLGLLGLGGGGASFGDKRSKSKSSPAFVRVHLRTSSRGARPRV